MNNRTTRYAAYTAILGTILLIGGIVLSVILYDARNETPFVPWNHFISELGLVRRADTAWVFNGSLALGSVMFIPLVLVLGRHIGTRLGYAAMGSGLLTILAAGLVGAISLDHLKPHLLAAVIFFLSWLTTVTLFTMSCFFDKRHRLPRRFQVIGIGTILLCAVFLALPKSSLLQALKNLDSYARPQIWLHAVMEWLVFLSTCLWMSVASVFLLGKQGRVISPRGGREPGVHARTGDASGPGSLGNETRQT